MNRSRPIVHDSSYPISGSRDRRRFARDDYPADARAALADHMQRCMQSDDYAKACILLDYLISALLGPDAGEGEGEPSAMDSRVIDHRPGVLAGMFPASANPRLAPNAGARDPSAAMKERLLDPRPSELAKMFPDAANPHYR